MKKYLKNAVFCLLLIFLSICTMAQQAEKAPLSPAFLEYLELKEQGEWSKTTKDGYSLGYIPPPFEFITSDRAFKSDVKLPALYDLRDVDGNDFSSPVKNQGNCGSCWAFATMAAIESNMLMLGEGSYNLSENHVKQNHGFELGPCDGGSPHLSTAYLTRGDGVIKESDAPYHDYDHSTYNGNPPVRYVTDAVYLPNNKDLIKQHIMNHGALYTNMHWTGDAYNQNDFTYYYNGDSNSNHAVNLVGWDESKVTQGGTGAWIVRNSWGANWGDDGYFYIAYQDTQVNATVAYWPEAIAYEPDQVIDYYDELGATNFYGYSNSTEGYALIKFSSSSDYDLSKIGTFIREDGTTVTIDLYEDFSGGNLSNHIAGIPAQVVDHAGYATIDLSSAVGISQGDSFFVKIHYDAPTTQYAIPAEIKIDDYAHPDIASGVSWISPNGSSWLAVGAGEDFEMNLCVKLYGLKDEDEPDPDTYPLILEVQPEGAGTVTGAGKYAEGISVAVSATPAEGYQFINWSGDVEHIDDTDSETATVTMPAGDVELTANFALIDYQLTVNIEPDGAGTVDITPDQANYNVGDEVELTLTPDEGWAFVNWTGDVEHIDDTDSETATVTMPAGDVELTANFNEDDTSLEEPAAVDINIFPNPTRNKFTVESSEKIVHIRLIDVTGNVIKDKAADGLSYELNVHGLQTGIYFIEIHTDISVLTKMVQITR